MGLSARAVDMGPPVGIDTSPLGGIDTNPSLRVDMEPLVEAFDTLSVGYFFVVIGFWMRVVFS
jgi:hypothetical protein